jgi:hypothetical protein
LAAALAKALNGTPDLYMVKHTGPVSGVVMVVNSRLGTGNLSRNGERLFRLMSADVRMPS